MTETTTTAEGWAFVQDHLQLIDRFAKSRTFNRTFIDSEDFRADLIEDVVTHIHLYDPKRGSPRSWIFTRARLTRLRHTRRWHKHEREHSAVIDGFSKTDERDEVYGDAMEPEANRLIELRDATALASRIMSLCADVAEEDAALSVMEGWSSKELEEILGISRGTRNHHVRRLRARSLEAIPEEER